MSTATAELTPDQEFCQVWWESDTLQDVIDYYKEKEGFDGKTNKQLASKLKIWATKIRQAGVDMRYFEGRISSATVVDSEGLLDFLDEIGISKKDRRKASDQAEENKEVTKKRLAGKKKKAR